MKKEQRLRVYNKYSCKCAYCGNDLEYKNMQVDHLHPKARSYWYKSEKMKIQYGLRGDNIDSFENLMPSCRRCNHYKRSHTLDEFAKLIRTLHERIKDQYIVKVAVDYELITFNRFNGYFWFQIMETDYIKYRGKCLKMCKEAIELNPELRLVRGYYYCPIWNKKEAHWWTVELDGEIYDPTKDQFPSRGMGDYEEFNGILNVLNVERKFQRQKHVLMEIMHIVQ